MFHDSLKPRPGDLAKEIGSRAENLYLTGQLLCSEAVLTVLNRGLGGGMPDEMAIRLASALPIGLGDSGCTCGALSGAVLALGLFLGRDRPAARDKKEALPSANLLHDRFRERFGSACCRVLSRKVKHNPKEHFKQCAVITGWTAELAALVILQKRLELADAADFRYCRARDSWLGSKLKKLVNVACR
ncbi:MAG: C_GCAxxG_C_C family protein [Desulfomonile tiedjei]|nr:C_GCAxxG_C_C family protein [Desulfomonile tiedjei]